MLNISGSGTYKFDVSNSLIPIGSYINPGIELDNIRKLNFSDNIIKILEKYFDPNICMPIFFLGSDSIEITQNDLDLIHYQDSCLEMINCNVYDPNYFSQRFCIALQNKNNLTLVPKSNGKLYLTMTLFNHILNYLGLDNIRYPYIINTFADDFRFIKKKIIKTKINTDSLIQKKITQIDNLKNDIANNFSKLVDINFDLYIPLHTCINLTQYLIPSLYRYFELIYLCQKKKYRNKTIGKFLELYDRRFVCLVESVYLKILARSKNKNKVGFVHFYKYYNQKYCDCAQIHNLQSDKLLDEIKFIAKSNYCGCSTHCNNFYENKWDCSDFDPDIDINEPIEDDFIIWSEDDDDDVDVDR